MLSRTGMALVDNDHRTEARVCSRFVHNKQKPAPISQGRFTRTAQLVDQPRFFRSDPVRRLVVGLIIEHRPARTVTETDHVLTLALTGNPAPVHSDLRFCVQSGRDRPLVLPDPHRGVPTNRSTAHLDAAARSAPGGLRGRPFLHPWMLRVLDLPDAVRLRGWPRELDLTLHLEVVDDTRGGTERFALRVATGQGELTPSTGDAGLVCLTGRHFAVWYCGGFRTATAATLAGVRGDPHTVARFVHASTDREPWLPDYF
jgi:hypothetical protein